MIEDHKKKRVESGFKWTKPKNPKLLILSKSDWASIGLRLSDAINQHTDWSSYCISVASNLIPNPLLPNPINEPKIRELMRTADVILFGSSFYGWLPYSEPINPRAMLGIMHPGSAYRNKPEIFNSEVHPKLDFVVVCRDFKNLCKDPIIVFNPVDVTKYNIVANRPLIPITVGHSPSGWGLLKEKGRLLKGTHHLVEAMVVLKKKYGERIKVDIIQDLTLEECLERKKKCHIFFDQIGDKSVYTRAVGELPMYGTSLIEAACFGSVCLSETDFSPIYPVKNADDIVKTVSYFMDNPDKLVMIGNKTREWVIQTHGYQFVANNFISDLENKLCGL